MVQTVGCAVMLPAAETVIHHAARRKVFRDRATAIRLRNIHQTVHDLPYIPLSACCRHAGQSGSGGDLRPFLVRQITRRAKLAGHIGRAERESQTIPMIQDVPERTLKEIRSFD